MNAGSRLAAFTFPEALVTVGLLILFASLGGVLYFQGTSVAGSLERHQQTTRSKLELAGILPQVCQRITPPSWANQGQVFSSTSEGLEVLYWDSDPTGKLTLKAQGSTLEVISPLGHWSWSVLSEVSVEYWKISGRVVGLLIRWLDDSTPQDLHLAWGSLPL